MKVTPMGITKKKILQLLRKVKISFSKILIFLARKKKEKNSQKTVTPAAPKVKITGYLNIIADTAHNFTDGMAIAASFLISTKVRK
jgi:zinc transporter ZupT